MYARIIACARGLAVLLSLAACVSRLSFARAAKDVIVMKNGDRFTCEVKSLEAGVLRVNLDYVDGTISVDWLRVARVESDYLFLIMLQDGSIFSAKVISPQTDGGDAEALIIQPNNGESFTADRTTVVRIAQTAETFPERLSGSFNIGATYAKGNNTTQYNFGSELLYRQTRWSTGIRYNSNLSASTGAETATRNQLDLFAIQQLSWRNYFLGGFASFLQSSVQGIEHQTSLGGGLGRYLKNTNRFSFSVLGGVGWQRTGYVQSVIDQPPQNIVVGLFSTNLQAFTFKQTRFNITNTLFPALTRQPGRLFLKTNATYYVKLFGRVDWNLSFYGSWDTQPPPHFNGSDYGTSTGLSKTFGNK